MKKFVLLFLTLFLVAPAAAHTALVSSNPKSGAVLTELPPEIRLKFNENLLLVNDKNPNTIEVFNDSGELISGTTEVSGPEVFVPLTVADVSRGNFTVTYRVVSGDGHPIEGEYEFTVFDDVVTALPISEPGAEAGPNLLIRFIWVLLGLSVIGLAALLRFGKKVL